MKAWHAHAPPDLFLGILVWNKPLFYLFKPPLYLVGISKTSAVIPQCTEKEKKNVCVHNNEKTYNFGMNFTICLPFLFQVSMANVRVCTLVFIGPFDNVNISKKEWHAKLHKRDPSYNQPELGFNTGSLRPWNNSQRLVSGCWGSLDLPTTAQVVASFLCS